jgi:DNA polymerase-1
LDKLAKKNPIVQNMISFRRLMSLKGTFVEGLLDRLENGRVHSTFNQHGAPTGRFSSGDPNLQNIPVMGRDPYIIVFEDGRKEEFVPNIRKAYVADPGYYFFDADYSQIEYRMLMGQAGEFPLIKLFREGHDFHAMTAAMINHKDVGEVTKAERDVGKTTNFRLAYLGGPGGLAEALDISREEAVEIIQSRDDGMPAVQVFKMRTFASMRDEGCVRTHFGRIRYVPELFSPSRATRAWAERSAWNTVTQGGAADVLKMGMVKLGNVIEEKYSGKIFIVLTVHDELLLMVRNEIPPREVWDLCRENMEMFIPEWPDLIIDAKVGVNWGEMEKYDPEKSYNFDTTSSNAIGEEFSIKASQTIQDQVLEPEKPPQRIILELKEPLSRPTRDNLLELLNAHSGKNTLVIRTGDADVPLNKNLTSLGLDDAGLINTVVLCDVLMDEADVNAEDILT